MNGFSDRGSIPLSSITVVRRDPAQLGGFLIACAKIKSLRKQAFYFLNHYEILKWKHIYFNLADFKIFFSTLAEVPIDNSMNMLSPLHTAYIRHGILFVPFVMVHFKLTALPSPVFAVPNFKFLKLSEYIDFNVVSSTDFKRSFEISIPTGVD